MVGRPTLEDALDALVALVAERARRFKAQLAAQMRAAGADEAEIAMVSAAADETACAAIGEQLRQMQDQLRGLPRRQIH